MKRAILFLLAASVAKAGNPVARLTVLPVTTGGTSGTELIYSTAGTGTVTYVGTGNLVWVSSPKFEVPPGPYSGVMASWPPMQPIAETGGIIRVVTYPVRHPVKLIKKTGHIAKKIIW